MTLKDKLKECGIKKRALLATNFYNLETLQGVLKAAQRKDRATHTSTDKKFNRIHGSSNCCEPWRTGLKEFGVEGWIHLGSRR